MDLVVCCALVLIFVSEAGRVLGPVCVLSPALYALDV